MRVPSLVEPRLVALFSGPRPARPARRTQSIRLDLYLLATLALTVRPLGEFVLRQRFHGAGLILERDLLFDKAGGGKLAAFVKHGKGTIDDAIFGASQEWASIATPAGYPTNKVKINPDG